MYQNTSQRRLVVGTSLARAGSNRRLSLLTGGSSRRLSAAGSNDTSSQSQNNDTHNTPRPSSGGGAMARSTAQSVDVVTYEERVNRIRDVAVSFLGGRALTEEEEDVLQQDCAALLLQNNDSTSPQKDAVDVEDHHVVRRVINSLLSGFFMQQDSSDNSNHDAEAPHARASLSGAGSGTPTGRASSSAHLEIEAAQVEAIAVLRLQAFGRGLLCRRQLQADKKSHLLPSKTTPSAITTATSSTGSSTIKQRPPRRLPPKSGKIQRLLSANSQKKADNLSLLLDEVDGTVVDVAAAIALQSFVRGFLVRQQHIKKSMQGIPHSQEPSKDTPTTTQPEIIVETQPTDVTQQSEQEESPTTTPTTTSPEQDDEIPPPPPPLQERQSSSQLRPISETEVVVDADVDDLPLLQDTSSKRTSRSQRINGKIQTAEQQQSLQGGPFRRNLSLLGMQYLNKSQTELSSVTEIVKKNILIKLQALVRGFLVRRRRRKLRKELSIRAFSLRRPRTSWKGTLQEHVAATAIQRTVRGYVQRWKYWTAMRQQQLEEIRSLQAKQKRKIEERKKSVMKAYRKQIFFDATSLARQLQRAKRAIKFLVKEERRQLQQNDYLSAQIREFQKTNQLLSNSTDTASNSNETLQAEITELEHKNAVLQSKKQEDMENLKVITAEWKQVNKDTSTVKEEIEKLQSVLERVRERAGDFLKDQHPELLSDDTKLTSNGSSNGLSGIKI